MSIWQTQSWQEMLKKSRQVDNFFEIDGMFVEKRSISLEQFGLFVIGLEGSFSSETFEKLKNLCKQERCIFIQIETIHYTEELTSIPGFNHGYFKKFIPPYTALIDLTRSEDDILATMKPKGRYNIKLAAKKGVVVEQVDKNLYNAKIFYELMQETTSRDNFAGNTLKYYEQFLQELEDVQIFFAYYQDVVIAAGIFVFHQDTALYYYGASGNTHRNLMAPYLLQWTVITHAKKRNLKYYDFLGVASPKEINSPLEGVTDFKMKLSPEKVYVSQGYIFISNTILYRLIGIMIYIKNKIKK